MKKNPIPGNGAVADGRFWIAVALMAAGCAGAPPARSVTEMFLPAKIATSWQSRMKPRRVGNLIQVDSSCAPISPLGPPPAGQVFAGYEFEAASSTAACRVSRGVVYRGGFRFDFPDLKETIRIATLNLKRGDVGKECGVSVYAASAEWPAGYLEGFLPAPRDPKRAAGRFEPGQSETSADVTFIVRGWIAHERANNGFIFMGDDESYPDRTARCVASIQEARLTIVSAPAQAR